MKLAVFFAIGLCTTGAWGQKTLLTAMPDRVGRTPLVPSAAIAPVTEVYATVRVQMKQADGTHRGEVWLELSADAPGEHAKLRIPLSSTEDVYGEDRACTTRADGSLELVYSAGMDEENFVSFAVASQPKEFHLLLNKYLCRLLAAPFHCDGKEIALKQPWSAWKVGRERTVELAALSPAAIELDNVSLEATSIPFDYAKCATAAPSNGFCCVGGKTTEWHCGGTPVGEGWHQVSGECFHRETGGVCKD